MAGKDMSAQRMTMIRFGLGLGLLIYFLFNVYPKTLTNFIRISPLR